MESWRQVWRQAILPLLSDEAIKALQNGLAEDDVHLLQGRTTNPPPLMEFTDLCVDGACPLGYCAWQGEGLQTVGEVEEWFARMCFEVDKRLGEPAGCRWFLNWVDETPREEMRTQLLAEVEEAIAQRQSLVMAMV